VEATLCVYQRGALDEIPTLRMIRTPAAEIERRAEAFVERLSPMLPADAGVEIKKGNSVIGGGSTPDQSLPTFLIAITSRGRSAVEIEARLRQPESGMPVITRVERNHVVVDLRTVEGNEESTVAAAIVFAVSP